MTTRSADLCYDTDMTSTIGLDLFSLATVIKDPSRYLWITSLVTFSLIQTPPRL